MHTTLYLNDKNFHDKLKKLASLQGKSVNKLIIEAVGLYMNDKYKQTLDTFTNNEGIKIIVKGETVTLYFDQNLDLNEQKHKLLNKVKELDNKINSLKTKLKNKSFLKNAPKQIISKDKKALIDYEIELKKLNSILNSIKN